MMMKNTVQIFMIRFSIFLIVVFLAGCTSPKHEEKKNIVSQKNDSTVIKKQNQEEKTFKKPAIPLTDANVEATLLEYGNENTQTLVMLKTPKGNMKIRLYKNTPLHRANLIRLIKNNFYKETVFYRVVQNFIIQGGGNDGWERVSIKNSMGNYSIPAEFRSENIHKKGALSMARSYDNNPEKRSVSFDWFIVQGTKYNDTEILGAEKTYDLKISAENKNIYKTLGGTPSLDGQHTVFGEVIEGFDVIDSIAAVKVDEGDWPIQDVTIEFQILE